MSDEWGVGNATKAPAFDEVQVAGNRLELIHGEHPHTRRDDSIYARWPDGRIDGFNGHRIRARIEVEEENYLKESHLSGDEVRKGGSCKIYLDDFPVYEFFHRDAQRALIRAHGILDQLYEHPIQFWRVEDRERLIGRKVRYRAAPAIVTRYLSDQGAVILEPDGISRFPKAAHAYGEDNDWADDDGPSVKDDIFSAHIWWFRD